MAITCNESNDRENVIRFFYQNEPDRWHREVHKNGGSLVENIKDTLSCIDESEKFFVIEVDGDVAAFFSRFDGNGKVVLNSFHVSRGYRNKYFLSEFWRLVGKELGDDYYAGLYAKNTDAILHLVKNGFIREKEVVFNEKDFVILHKLSNI